jgi:hypothetical protein
VVTLDSADLMPLMNERERLRKLEFIVVVYMLYIHINIFSMHIIANANGTVIKI